MIVKFLLFVRPPLKLFLFLLRTATYCWSLNKTLEMGAYFSSISQDEKTLIFRSDMIFFSQDGLKAEHTNHNLPGVWKLCRDSVLCKKNEMVELSKLLLSSQERILCQCGLFHFRPSFL